MGLPLNFAANEIREPGTPDEFDTTAIAFMGDAAGV